MPILRLTLTLTLTFTMTLTLTLTLIISSTDASQVQVWVRVQLVHAITYNYDNFLELVFVTTAAIPVHKFASILCTACFSVNTATTGFILQVERTCIMQRRHSGINRER